MYTLIFKENGYIHEFDGDFDEFLLSKGIEPEHLKKMKRTLLQPSRDEYYTIEQKEEIILVPLDKVEGTSRGSVGVSIYENVRKTANGNREPSKFTTWLGYLDEMSLKKLFSVYENLNNPVRMIYYADDDVYYLSGDGNHRTLTAKLLGAPYIKAKVLTAHCNFSVREKYTAEKTFYKKYNIDHIVGHSPRTYMIYFRDKDSNSLYTVCGYNMEKDETCFEIIDNLSNQIDSDQKAVRFLTNLPEFLRRFIVNSCKNKRLWQYFTKLSPMNPNPLEKTIHLYNL